MASISTRRRAAAAWFSAHRGISVLKGALAYTLVIMLPMAFKYDKLNKVPLTYSAGVIIAIAGFPGNSIGECLFGVTLAMLGVALGAANFAILSKLRGSLVAQAIVFVIMIYCLALVKASDPRLFGFSLLAVLMTFYGVYVSILVDGFSPKYLESYFEAYLWGAAVVVAVNLLVFPMSSEKQLRQTLVLSLDHIGTFAHLLAKTYTKTLTDEERVQRDQLNQTIRQDFGILNQKVGASALEINYSRWSIGDYHNLISQTRSMQLSLIALYSSLAPTEDAPVPLFEEHFLPSTLEVFVQLRRDIHRTIVEIQLELGCKPSKTFGHDIRPSQAYFDLEKQEGPTPSNSLGTAPSAGGLRSRAGTAAATNGEKPATSESQGTMPSRPTIERMLTNAEITSLNSKLMLEAEHAAPLPPDSAEDRDGDEESTSAPSTAVGMERSDTLLKPPTEKKEAAKAKGKDPLKGMLGCAKRLRKTFLAWENTQRELLTDAIISGELTGGDQTLYIKEPRPSIWETIGPDHVRGQLDAQGHKVYDMLAVMRQRKANGESRNPSTINVANADERKRDDEDDVDLDNIAGDDTRETDARDISSNHSLMRVFSVIFALDQFSSVLAQCHSLAKKKDSKGRPRKYGLHIHIFELLRRKKHAHHEAPPPTPSPRTTSPLSGADMTPTPSVAPSSTVEDDREYSMLEAIARLEGRDYVPRKADVWQRLHKIEKASRSPTSVYAMKVAFAALVFGALIWADGSRAFFIKYNITGSLLTIVVALTPTLGQSLRSFVLQIAGSGTGYIVGMISESFSVCLSRRATATEGAMMIAVLEIFKDVGGYHFNPYGIVCLVAVWSLPMSFILYTMPQYFVFGLLGMNACGVLIVGEYVNVVYNHNIAYGSPPLRVGRSLAGLAIALGIVIAFQLLILRNPARKTLRKSLADLVYANLSYHIILQALVRGTMSTDPTFKPSPKAVKQVVADLAHRETEIQQKILGIMPLIAFAKDEPQLVKKFEGAAIVRIVRANQIILDRQAECRAAIGNVTFSTTMIQAFVATLSPYRKRILSLNKARFVLAAASLASKTPLPHDYLHSIPENWIGTVTHDALVLSQEFAKTPEGKRSIESGEFTRFWFYLLSLSSLAEQLQVIEDSCRVLFGEVEDDPRLG